MDRRTFLSSSSSFLLAATALGLTGLTGCRGKRRRRRAVRRAVRRRRRRFRRAKRRWIRRGGRRVHVHVVPVHVEVEDTIELEEHGSCTVVAKEEERLQVKTAAGETTWVDVQVEGDDQGTEVEEG